MRRYVLGLVFIFGNVALAIGPEYPLYRPHVVLADISDKQIKAELKITPDQQKKLDAAEPERTRIWKAHSAEVAKVPYKDKDKDAKIFKLEQEASAKMFESIGKTLTAEQMKRYKQVLAQIGGMMMFEHKEVRDLLKIDQKQMDKMNAAYREIGQKIQAEIKSAKLTEKEVKAKYGKEINGIPEKVRDMLSAEQKKKLDELIGEPFDFDKK